MSQIKKYLIFTFLFSWIIELVGVNGLETHSLSGKIVFAESLAFSMFMPTLGAFLAGADLRGMHWRLNAKKNIRLIAFALLVPTLLQLAGAALYFFVFPKELDLSGGFLAEFDPDAYDMLKRRGDSYMGYVAGEIITSQFSFYFPISVLIGLGEEIGWRGFLFPELDSRCGRTKAVLLGGVIHGVWHFPIMLIAGYEYGKHYIGAPVLGLFAFCVFTVTTGIIAYHLYERSKSIWLPAIYHAAVNSTFNPYLLGGFRHPERSVFGPADIGLISVIPAAALALLLLRADNKRERWELELL